MLLVPEELLERVRVGVGLTQEELARRAGTSRTTLSAYEHGRKSPTVATFARLLSEAGCDLAAQPHVSFTQQSASRGRPVWVPDRLPRLDVARALAVVELPLHLNWSAPGRVFDLGSRPDRARVYEIVLQEGPPGRHPGLHRWCAAGRPVGRPGDPAGGPASMGPGNPGSRRGGGVMDGGHMAGSWRAPHRHGHRRLLPPPPARRVPQVP